PGNIGFVFLGAEGGGAPAPALRLRNFRMFSGHDAYSQGGEPTNDAERYACLNGTSPASLPPPGATPRSPVLSAFDADYRILVSIGPFPALAPGESLHVAMAMVLGSTQQAMLQNAARAKILYDGVTADCDGNPNTPEECVVHWTTPLTVPVLVSEIEALRTPTGARLSWRLAEEARRALRGLYVQRAPSASGPFARRPSGLLEPATTTFDDSDLPPTAWYRLELEHLDGTSLVTRSVRLDGEATAAFSLDVEASEAARVRVRYVLAQSAETRLTIHDVSGRLLTTLRSSSLPAGTYSEEWNGTTNAGRRVPRGVYVVRLEAGGRVLTRKLLIPTRVAP
ncbi:MAG TPA: FlgD immunoglobulin-like domain containing protein, partial [Candidatus Krumholzibacteria bacterium]|nr:FlgD immunoglobulin-like domain containing protein [Candidatus Krumholzibacteria bacterium]